MAPRLRGIGPRPLPEDHAMLAKRFFYVCVGMLCLAFAYHFGATRAAAQGAAKGKIRFVEARGAYVLVVSESDDIYVIDPDKLREVARGTGWWKFSLEAVK
jgi:hypothetical protein